MVNSSQAKMEVMIIFLKVSIAIYTNGDKYDGDFVNGIREGDGIYYWKEGEKYIGKYKNNKRNGYGKYYDANGNIIEQGFYVNGVLQ
ncbi:MAG: hypothetical protein IPH74_12475 [Bacteroidetes bacterium]|nr:hypothetical protein [Bacteroidota bacterium]